MTSSSSEWSNTLSSVCPGLKVPDPSQPIWKEECTFSFANLYSEGGLFLNLSTFQALARPFLGFDHQRKGNVLYLYMHIERVTPNQEMEGSWNLEDDWMTACDVTCFFSSKLQT